MKTLSLGLLLFATSICSSSAQVKIGARVGFNLSALTLEDDNDKEERKMLPGVNAGFVLDKGEKVMFSTGLFVSMQGWKGKEDEDKELFRITYLNLPLHVKVNIGGSEKRITGFFHCGPYIAFLFKAKEVTIYDGDKTSSPQEIGWDDYHRADFGLSLGGGINIPVGKQVIQAGPAFAMGFIGLEKYSDGTINGKDPYLNLVLAGLNVNYMFRVGNGGRSWTPQL